MPLSSMLGPDGIKVLVANYQPDADMQRIDDAWQFAARVHEGQEHFSGTPYLLHLQEVGATLASMQLDLDTILAALLHGTIKHGVEITELRDAFGDDVASIVEGASRITKVQYNNKLVGQAEGVRKMLLAIAADIRVLLVRLVDRLTDLFNLEKLPRERQLEIAWETMNLYAPLASRLGIDWLKRELEDNSFRFLYPDEYAELSRDMESSLEERESYVAEMLATLKGKLEENDIHPLRVLGRPKHLYSIYKKLVAQNIKLDKVYDKVAFRIIVDSVKECYETLGVIHGEWAPVPGRIKDFISVPKANNYQSMHTTVAGPCGHFIEIQIRTEEMDRVASEGVAAHWAYKEGQKTAGRDAKLFGDLKNLVKSLKDVEDPREFLDSVQGELYDPDVYVLTPGGEVKEFRYGSCPIDFAYAVHSEVGDHCTGAKVNGRLVPLKYHMQNGDIIEILTSPSQHPRRGWLDFVQSGRAKARIRSWFRREENERALKLGREICEREIRLHNTSLKKLVKSGQIRLLFKELRCNSLDDMLIKVGNGGITIENLVKALQPHNPQLDRDVPAQDAVTDEALPILPKQATTQIEQSKDGLRIAGVEGMLVRVGQCCRPVPGDKVIGFITHGRGVTVHKADCSNLGSTDPHRRIDVDWAQSSSSSYRAVLHVVTENSKGIFSEVSAIIAGESANMVEMSARVTVEDTAEFTLSLEVKDLEQLQHLMQILRQMPVVISVRRL
ncbi:RelA/SpoT family protein [Desulfotalea psychrophila]|uniref:Probable GTP pyrophosphokinase n=1 Tax=Desulfotalea psychrophila (strain LSv54 / DSM 12343) TaxID=177439 RepID=Q6AP30_DESPS|nr:bifunctional (p)ppGpp synthetase/guanosine-3',5'-bis(diphosphate) 3'-pyrophosphohydrolase [Desulfotalea psychrophila]CAG35894.1 probable GTP pyrophosphokinase [Desulfotalea psychrophila LSv54]